MGVSKVIYHGDVLVDLTGDTVTEDALLFGHTAHASDGSMIEGTLFQDYPQRLSLDESIQDSGGDQVFDSLGNEVMGHVVYGKQ